VEEVVVAVPAVGGKMELNINTKGGKFFRLLY
jgi:hypothetical protein